MRLTLPSLFALLTMALPSMAHAQTDAGRMDATVRDTGLADTGVRDTGVRDTGLVDTGVHDTGLADTGARDTGLLDSGVPRTCLYDAGDVPPVAVRLPDVAVPDVGTPPDAAHVPGRCPNILIVLDNSASMSNTAQCPGGTGTGPSKWDTAVNAINALVAANGEHNRFGLTLFPCPSCTTQCIPPTADQAILVHPALGTADMIGTALASARRVGSTPTAYYLEAVRSLAELNDPTRPSYVLLITDGMPTCTSGVSEPLAAIEALGRIGVKTFVVGFDLNSNASFLDEFAVAGGTALPPPSAHRFYPATDEASLRDAFTAIAQTVSEELGSTLCDESCYSQGCPDGGVCASGACGADPCASVTCAAGSYCAHGMCQQACINGCAAGQLCQDGACVDDPCSGMSCEGCANGTCPTAGCLDADGGVRNCGIGRVCVGDTCQDYPCDNVHCPAGTVCDRGGGCQGVRTSGVDAGADGALADVHNGNDTGSGTTGSHGGCACRATHPVSRDRAPATLALLAALGLIVRRRRSSRR